jgi:hypothetical protein
MEEIVTNEAPIDVSGSARVSNGSTFAPPAAEPDTLMAASTSAWPVYAYYRDKNHYLSENGQLTYLALNISLGVIVALVVAVLGFDNREARRRLALLSLLGLAAILVSDIVQGIWMDWPRHYVAVLCADHVGAAVLAGAAAVVVLHLWRYELPTAPRNPERPTEPAQA